MIARSYRTERVCAALLGALLLSAGGAALALHLIPVDRPVVDPLVVDRVRDHLLWARIGALVLALVAIAVGLRWAWRALTPEPHPDLELGDDLVVTSGALAQAVKDDVERVDGVSAATVKVVGDPGLRLVLTLRQNADVRAVWQQLDAVLGRARSALGVPNLPAAVRLDLASRARRRVG